MDLHEFKASLVYSMNTRAARDIKNPISKKGKKKSQIMSLQY